MHTQNSLPWIVFSDLLCVIVGLILTCCWFVFDMPGEEQPGSAHWFLAASAFNLIRKQTAGRCRQHGRRRAGT
jgi:hypothetical protein